MKPGDIITTLRQRGSVSSIDDAPTQALIVIGWVGEFTDNINDYGHDDVDVYLVRSLQTGKLLLLLRRDWHPNPGYCAEGVMDVLIPLPKLPL